MAIGKPELMLKLTADLKLSGQLSGVPKDVSDQFAERISSPMLPPLCKNLGVVDTLLKILEVYC